MERAFECKRLADQWRSETIADRGLSAELEDILARIPAAMDALSALADPIQVDDFDDAMTTCIAIEGVVPSQGWRIEWTRKAQEGAVGLLVSSSGASWEAATEAYWAAAASFVDGVQESARDYFGVQLDAPAIGVNIGWLLGTGPADAAHDALLVISVDALAALDVGS